MNKKIKKGDIVKVIFLSHPYGFGLVVDVDYSRNYGYEVRLFRDNASTHFYSLEEIKLVSKKDVLINNLEYA